MHLADGKSNLCLAKMGPINDLSGRLAVSRKMGSGYGGSRGVAMAVAFTLGLLGVLG